MGLRSVIADIIRVARGGVTVADVRGDSGGAVNATGEHYAPPGDDSQALPGDYALMIKAERTNGEFDVVGYIDTQNVPESAPGEKRLYARDATTAAVVGTVWLKNDGSILIENSAGSVELEPTGAVKANGAEITILGDVVSPVGALFVRLLSHTHPVVGANTGPPTPVT